MALLAVTYSNGWHLPIVQGIAWLNMYDEYREDLPASEALEEILSGENLCNLCQYVRSSNPAQEEQDLYGQSDKSNPLIAFVDAQPTITPRSHFAHHTIYTYVVKTRWEDREIPPPKGLLV